MGQKQFITPVTEFRSSSFPPPIHPLHILLVRVEYWCVQKIFIKLSTFTFFLHHVNETCANAKVFQGDFVASIYLQKVRCDPNAGFFFHGGFSVKMTNVILFLFIFSSFHFDVPTKRLPTYQRPRSNFKTFLYFSILEPLFQLDLEVQGCKGNPTTIIIGDL